ncbi:molybdopterin-containing oxidoreductase family protein [Ancylobacter amanitiformis]|uniref:Anaerobic selenocysteine-containing dehydrogenase n=1 Tax=Ancylobacter amanitiformis TaxID=217069 RepID=A0ABU0LN97_9HYPH|nr:molybdopterin oxidoreductase family protein [Ancylobacter amanitiformis]MDQ0510176.1 anaerobic selenocysteine-containing dehydrogenase [Ancylobacter amanitiformis]
MNQHISPTGTGYSACPHDCPSTCALEIDISGGRIGRVRGSSGNSYTAGVICAKVARYGERANHPDRLTQPLRRIGPKGEGAFAPISWDEALDEIAERFKAAESRHGAESVWPYYYAGTMGLVMRDGINRLTHAKGYSRFFSSICVNPAWGGFMAGTGKLAGPDPREIGKADLVVIWGTNPVATQVNVMTHAIRARKERGAKIAVIDVYRSPTMELADIPVLIRPGTDGALACAIMHVLFRDDLADRAYLARYADDPAGLEAHLATRTPEWAAAITGLPANEIEAFAHAIGRTPRTFIRAGYGFTRSRNGAVNMHAVSSIATVAGLWQHEGGGAFHTNGAIFRWNKQMIEGLDIPGIAARRLDQSRIGDILAGDADALLGGPPVSAMLIQSTNPVSVASDQDRVRAGFAREDLFVAVHEQFMTETARMADIVLPATMFTEHDDLYQGGGNQYVILGPKLVEPPGECRSNHDVVCALAPRVGAEHAGFHKSSREIVDWTLQATGRGTVDELEAARFLDVQPDFETAHYLKGFNWPDGRFHLKPDWASVPFSRPDKAWAHAPMPEWPDHWDVIEEATAEFPFRLVTSPARSFLNSSFTETPSSTKREKRPELMIHPEDAAALGIADGDLLRVESPRGAVLLHARLFDGVRRGVVVAESIWPNRAHEGGRGINSLTGADPVAPFGGAALHDNRVRITRQG